MVARFDVLAIEVTTQADVDAAAKVLGDRQVQAAASGDTSLEGGVGR